MKVYIAQPMQHHTDQEIQSKRKAAEDYILARHEDSEVVFTNRYMKEFADESNPLECLGKSLEFLANSDMAFFVPGWENSRGCQIESMCCDLYGIPWVILPEDFAEKTNL